MNSRYWRYAFIGLLIYLLAPASFYQLPGRGIDSSYIIGVHLAHRFGLVFGRDFVFTFGPLGILNNRLPIGVSRWVYLLFDIYFLVSLFFLFRKTIRGVVSGIFWVLALLLAFYEPLFQWYFIFFLFYLFLFIREPEGNWTVVQPILLAVLSFFYKLNLGVAAILLFLAALHYLVVFRRISLRRYGVLLGALIAGVWVSSIILRVALGGYVVGGLHLIDSYNDAMYLPMEGTWGVVLAAVAVMLAIGGCGLYLLFRRRAEGVLYVLGGGAVFVLFKSSFVRLDSFHTSHFFNIVGLLAAVLFFYSSSGKKWVCWAVLGICFVSSNFARGPVIQAGEYWKGLVRYPGPAVEAGKLREVIGEHSVDVIPTEVSKVYFNGLRYDPRPVIQSYSAYDTYLDSLNYAKYLSPGAPDYILFSLATIDGRCAYFDEPKTKLAIFSHYAVAGEVDGDLLLKKKETFSPMREVEGRRAVTARMGKEIAVDTGVDLQYARLFVDYSFLGRVNRWLYHPPPLTITLILDGGERKTYRAAAPMLADGILLNKFIDSKEDFQLLMQSGGKVGASVKAIQLDAAHGGYAKEFRMEVVRYGFPEGTAEDSAGVARLNGIAPDGLDTAMCRTDTFQCWAEYVRAHSPLIQIEGWVAGKKRIGVVLRSGERVYALPTEDVGPRPDVEAYYRWPSGLVEGYKARVSRAQLPPGRYQVGVSLYDSSSGVRRIRYLDNWVMGGPSGRHAGY